MQGTIVGLGEIDGTCVSSTDTMGIRYNRQDVLVTMGIIHTRQDVLVFLQSLWVHKYNRQDVLHGHYG